MATPLTRTQLRYDPAAHYEVDAHDVEYLRHGDRPFLARVYQPRGQGPFPTLIEIHGGAWNSGERTQNASIDAALAASGLVIAALDFRVAGDGPYPAAIQDINYATRWFKLHAADFNGAAAPFGGLGFSSGGHQIMLSALRPNDPRYAALPLVEAPDLDASLDYVAVGWPVLNPLARYQHAQNLGREDLIASHHRFWLNEENMREGNPQLILERGEPVALPPTLIVHGAEDKQVSPKTAEQFLESYAAAGGLIEVAKYPGAGHGFARQPGPNTDRALALIKSFIARQLAELA